MSGIPKHGMSRTEVYRVWGGMKTRCSNPKAQSYPRYGGRGIKVCQRWDDFINFYEDMGEIPAGHQIDRINNDGDYEPGNCRWATRSEQAMNRSIRTIGSNNTSGYKGVNFIKREKTWRAMVSVDKKPRVIGYFKKKEDAIKARQMAEGNI